MSQNDYQHIRAPWSNRTAISRLQIMCNNLYTNRANLKMWKFCLDIHILYLLNYTSEKLGNSLAVVFHHPLPTSFIIVVSICQWTIFCWANETRTHNLRTKIWCIANYTMAQNYLLQSYIIYINYKNFVLLFSIF